MRREGCRRCAALALRHRDLHVLVYLLEENKDGDAGIATLRIHLDLVWVAVARDFHGSGDKGCVLGEGGGFDGLDFDG